MSRAEEVTSLMPLKWELSEQIVAALSEESLEPRRSVDSTDRKRIATPLQVELEGNDDAPQR